ncbi:MAG: septal ring lytic transglycosylase RlpA family protein [Hormoscilla sp. GM102CHS1]|nr:septal ring lytic transglycosylase RlpA family protein [Hormoscilla sp. GM102CHS1]
MHQKVGKSIVTALILTGIGLSNHLEQTKLTSVRDVEKIPATAPRLLSDLADRLTDIVKVESSAWATEKIGSAIGRSGEKQWQCYSQKGWASWYGPGLHGNLTASGERFNQYDLTAAHRNLPFGTWVRVTNLNNNLSVVVRINDRGPYIRGRIIDVSAAAAQEVRMRQSGVVPVRVDVLGR